MGGIDPLKDIFHVSDEEKKALESASSIIGSIWSVWGTFNTAKSVLTTLGLLPQSDQVAQMRHFIDLLTQDFHGAVAALDKEQSMRAVADQLESARTQHLHLLELAPEDAATVGINATWDEIRPIVLNETLQAVVTLGDPAYWQRVFFPELTYQKWAPEQIHPIPVVTSSANLPSGLVYDYRLILPAYLEAISIRLTVLVAVVKDYQHAAIPELTQMISTLEGHFKKIRQSIYEVLWVPTDVVDSPDNTQLGVNSWMASGARVGAVEIYSAVDQAAPWPGEFPAVGFTGQNTPEGIAQWYKFLVRYAIRNWVRWKQLYDTIGLNAVAQTLITLKRMVGQTPTLPEPDTALEALDYTCHKIRSGDYSMRELARMMHDIGYSQWGAWEILWGDQGKLVNPISLRDMLALMQTYNPVPYTSVRDALRQ
jgi:hypothetical protein